MAQIAYFDAARQMLADIANDPDTEGCMAVVLVITKAGDLISAISYDDRNMQPFAMLGGLELTKARILAAHVDVE